MRYKEPEMVEALMEPDKQEVYEESFRGAGVGVYQASFDHVKVCSTPIFSPKCF